MVKGKNWKPIFATFTVVILILLWVEHYISNTEKALYERLEDNVITEMHSIATNIEKHLYDEVLQDDLYPWLYTNKEKRLNIEKELNILLSDKVKYLYLVYQDGKGRFRFLLDGSYDDKAYFNQKLDVESDAYSQAYKTGKPIALTQKGLDALSVTYLYPLKREKVEALLVFDFASSLEYELRNIIEPVKTMFFVVYILIGIFLLITAIQAFYYYQAQRRSFIDALTGAFNRQYLRAFLDKNNMNDYQLLMIDFDHFKKINDNYGHDIGDAVLIFGTQLIRESIRSEDKVFRYGGEEFLVLIKMHEQNDAEVIAERIRHKIDKAHYIHESIDINITVSIGVNPIPSHARNTSEAIKIADIMLYRAKTKGRNRCIVYTDKTILEIEKKHSIRDTIHQVKSAIEEDRIICHYHKIIDNKGDILKYEALVRYINDEDEIVYPNHFLPDLTHTKIYTDLSKRIIDICTDKILQNNIAISINFNVNDLLNQVLITYLLEKIELLGGKSSLLSIEILENEEIDNIEELQEVITELHKYGVKFSIDDFGSGYANFNYLVSLNIDYLKIDGSLVQEMVNSERSYCIVKSIIMLAKEMGIKTVAEFVSSQEIKDALEQLQIDYMQGYHISMPEPLE